MIIISYGGGTNSTALIIECAKRGIEIKSIVFADTGCERPHTYAYVKMLSDWCVEHGLPEIVTVCYRNKEGSQVSLYEHSLKYNCLPSIAYGFKACSMKFKVEPHEKYTRQQQWAKDEWEAGRKITKYIGYDYDEQHRAMNSDAKGEKDKKYAYEHPLIEWGMGRDECIETIKEEGLCLPGKSACYLCPSSKPTEIRQLNVTYPELMEKALFVESNADLTTVKGLGRNYAWSDLIKQKALFDDDDYFHTPEMTCGCYDG